MALRRRGFLVLCGASVAGLWFAGRGLISLSRAMVLKLGGECSFCGKSAAEVVGLAGAQARDSRICNECLGLCFDIMSEESSWESLRTGNRAMPPVRVPDLPSDQVGPWLSKYHSLPYDDLRSGIVFGIPPDIATKYQIEALKSEPGRTVVAMVNPRDTDLIRKLEDSLGSKIEVVVTTPEALEAARRARRAEIERRHEEFLASLEAKLDENDEETRQLIESVRRAGKKPKGNTRAIQLACSFCDKRQDQVAKLIAGPTVYICDGCANDGMAIFAAQLKRSPQS